jgi:hypothetical protein
VDPRSPRGLDDRGLLALGVGVVAPGAEVVAPFRGQAVLEAAHEADLAHASPVHEARVVGAVHPVEADVADDGLGEELVGAGVGAGAPQVDRAAHLLLAAVRVEVRVADGREEAEEARVRVDDLHLVRVFGRYPRARAGEGEEGQRRVQTCRVPSLALMFSAQPLESSSVPSDDSVPNVPNSPRSTLSQSRVLEATYLRCS